MLPLMTATLDLGHIGAIRHELRVLLGVPVDVLTPMALPDKIRESVLAEAVSDCACLYGGVSPNPRKFGGPPY